MSNHGSDEGSGSSQSESPSPPVLDPIFSDPVNAKVQYESVCLPPRSNHYGPELDRIRHELGTGTFDPLNHPKLLVAREGVPYVKRIEDENGLEGTMLKAMSVNLTNDLDFLDLAAHVRGFDVRSNSACTGFRNFRHQLDANRDGAGAYTMGLTVDNNTLIAPKAHLTRKIARSSGLVDWNKTFLELLGKITGKVMRRTMSKAYYELTKHRKAFHNSPCFGENDKSQTFCNTVQINYSTGVKPVGGTAGDVHEDGSDCAASYSFMVNCSVVRSSSDLGWFWLPGLDIVIPVKPGQAIIFQGIEEHTGTPLRLDPEDRSSIPCEYEEEVRYNIIAYPKGVMMDNSLQMNFNGERVTGSADRTVWKHAAVCFGGIQAYNAWRQRALVNLLLDTARRIYGIDGIGLTIDLQTLAKAIGWPGKRPENQYLSYRNFDDQAEAKGEFDDRIRVIRKAVLASRSRPFHENDRRTERVELEAAGPAAAAYTSSQADSDENSSDDSEDTYPTSNRRVRRSRSGRAPSAARASAPVNDILENLRGAGPDTNTNGDVLLDVEFPSDDPSATAITNNQDGLGMDDQIEADIRSATEEIPRQIASRNSVLPVTQLSTFMNPDQLTYHTAEMVHRIAKELNLHKGFKPLESLPRLEVVKEMSPVDRIRTCQAYGDIFYLYQEKSRVADIASRGFRAAFLHLLSEFTDVMNDTTLNIWLDSDTILPHESLALRLRNIIDQKFEVWHEEASHGSRRLSNLTVTASEVLADAYNEMAHLDVSLHHRNDIRSVMAESPENKGSILVQIIYGLFWASPVNRFLESLTNRRQPRSSIYKDRLQGGMNRHRKLIVSRLQFLRRLQEDLFPPKEERSRWGLTLVTEVLQFVFTVNSSDALSPADIEDFIIAFRDDSHSAHREAIMEAASLFGRHVTLFGYPNRGKRGLPEHEYQSLPVVRRKAPAEPAGGASSKRQRLHAGSGGGDGPMRSINRLRGRLDFAPDADTLDRSNLQGFDRCLLEYLLHSFGVGKMILRLQPEQDKILTRWGKTQRKFQDERQYTDPQLSLYIEKSARVWAPGDKYLLFRRLAPSMRLVLSVYPADSNIRTFDAAARRTFLWRLFLWRMYAFGKRSRLEKVASMTSLDDWHAMRQAKLDAQKPLKGNVMAYGQFRIHPEDRQLAAFTKFWNRLPGFMNTLFHDQDRVPTFQASKTALASMGITNLPDKGLVTWLITCDLSEYGLCAPPTVQDLTEKIGKTVYSESGQVEGGTGPSAAFGVIAEEKGIARPYGSASELARALEEVMSSFRREVGQEWEELTGREFNVVDLEHTLCKITREWKGNAA